MRARRRRPLPLPGRLYRLSRFLLHIAWGCLITALVFPFVGPVRKRRIIRRWSRQVISMLGVRVSVRGPVPGIRQPCLVVANHVSWMDIWVLHAVVSVRFVSKSDVRSWPVVGWLAEQAGTLFLERTRRRDAARIGQSMAGALAGGYSLAVFPEGTTTDGSHLLGFNASLFQPAVDQGAPVVAVGLRYAGPAGGPDADISYAGERTLPQSLMLILARRRVPVELFFSEPIDSRGRSRRELAREAEAWVAQALSLPLPHRKAELFAGPPGASRSASDPTGSPYPDPSHPHGAPVQALTSDRK